MGERGRAVIEQVGVIDAYHQATPLGPARQSVSDPAQKLQPAVRGRKAFRKKVSEGTERDGGAGAGGDDPRRGSSLPLGSADGLACETGLPNPCGPGKDNAGSPSGDRLSQITEFSLPSEQGPVLGHARQGWSPQRSTPRQSRL